jgi:hypothetical protein
VSSDHFPCLSSDHADSLTTYIIENYMTAVLAGQQDGSSDDDVIVRPVAECEADDAGRQVMMLQSYMSKRLGWQFLSASTYEDFTGLSLGHHLSRQLLKIPMSHIGNNSQYTSSAAGHTAAAGSVSPGVVLKGKALTALARALSPSHDLAVCDQTKSVVPPFVKVSCRQGTQTS